jgi:hypothetical protein
LASEAALDGQHPSDWYMLVDGIPMPFGSFESTKVVALLPADLSSGLTMVEVDDERLKVLASGARLLPMWTSLSFFVSFQLIVAVRVVTEGGVPDFGSGCRCGRHAAAKTGVYLGHEGAMDGQLVQARI